MTVSHHIALLRLGKDELFQCHSRMNKCLSQPSFLRTPLTVTCRTCSTYIRAICAVSASCLQRAHNTTAPSVAVFAVAGTGKYDAIYSEKSTEKSTDLSLDKNELVTHTSSQLFNKVHPLQYATPMGSGDVLDVDELSNKAFASNKLEYEDT